MIRNGWRGFLLAVANAVVALAAAGGAQAQGKPNILVMFGDDVGYWNVSAYNRGQMGYRTPNIDRIAKEGAIFTDAYAQQSCTAGRAAFITGQSPIRTGLTKVGLPGAPEGLSAKDPTIANLLKAQGYMTGQFGKNHLGDRNEFFPTVHGFDEFFGNFYHLNAEEEPENEDYPKNPEFKAKFGPRGVFKCVATATDSTLPDDPRFGKWGRQKCEDTGPLNRKRMETIDYEVADASMDFMTRATRSGKPFFLWFNTSRMHIWTHLKPESAGKTGLGVYPDGMVEHDNHIGMMLKKLEELGIANNTIVIWTTDNGAEVMSWPDGGTTPFRGEKNTNWEGGYRVPMVMRWPGVIQPGTEINDIVSHEDWLPTLLAAVGQPNVKEQLKAGATVDGTPYKVHLDGYNLMPALKGDTKDWPRKEFLVLDRRRQPGGSSLPAVEGRVHGAARPRLRRVAGAPGDAAGAQALQPALGPLRARGPRRDGVPALAHRPRVRARAGAGVRRQVAAELQGFPAAAEAGQLQHRRRDGEAEQARRQQLNRRNAIDGEGSGPRRLPFCNGPRPAGMPGIKSDATRARPSRRTSARA